MNRLLAAALFMSAMTANGAVMADARGLNPNPGKPAAPSAEVFVDGDMLRLRLPEDSKPFIPGHKELPRSSREWLERMLDSSRNGVAFKDPQAFIEWLDAITEPQFMTALATASLDPGTYNKALNRLIRPETARNWAEFTNPLLYMRWMMTGANPDFYNAIIERLSDPGKARRWAQSVGEANPSTSTMKTVTQPAASEKVITPVDYAAWASAFVSGVLHPSSEVQAWKRLPASSQPVSPVRRY
jgi:hypothetical protein